MCPSWCTVTARAFLARATLALHIFVPGGHAVHVRERAADPPALRDGSPSARSCHMPSRQLATRSTAEHDDFKPFWFGDHIPRCDPCMRWNYARAGNRFRTRVRFLLVPANGSIHAVGLLTLPSCWTPSTKPMPSRASGSNCALSSRRHRACAMWRSLYAIRTLRAGARPLRHLVQGVSILPSA